MNCRNTEHIPFSEKSLLYRFFIPLHSSVTNIFGLLLVFMTTALVLFIYEILSHMTLFHMDESGSHILIIALYSVLVTFFVWFVRKKHRVVRRNIMTAEDHAKEAILASEERFRMLNVLTSGMLSIKELPEMYRFITEALAHRYPDTIVLYLTVDEEKNVVRLETLSGLEDSILGKIISLMGYNPVGWKFALNQYHLEQYRTGNLIEVKNGLSEYESMKGVLSEIIGKMIGLNKIYAVGIHKNEKVLGGISIISLNGTEITDNSFIEIFVREAALIIQKGLNERTLKEDEERLVRLNSTKDQLFSIIGHDLRNMFSGILGISDMLISNHGKYTEKKNEDYLRLINSSAEQAFILLENLLAWAKSQTGQMDYNPELLDVDEIISDVLEVLDSSARIKNISLNHIKTCEPMVQADRNMIKTVLRNLIQNSIKFTNAGGRIDVFALESGNNVEVTINDTGIGISEEKSKNLFSLTSSTSGTANEKGSGLGLLLCKELIDKHNGSINVLSENGRGSSFMVTLPRTIDELQVRN